MAANLSISPPTPRRRAFSATPPDRKPLPPKAREKPEYRFETEHLTENADGSLSTFRYYFAQREAVETVSWLYEVRSARDKYDLLRFDASGAVSSGMFPEDWPRYVLKMATGAGKTKVLSLLIAWSFFHRLYEADSALSRNFLVITPNIIVLDRLRADFDGLKIFFNDPILPPNGSDGRNWRDDFQLTLHIQDDVRIVRTSDTKIWIVETKGRAELDLPQKMARLKQWCVDATAAEENGQQYDFVFVDQNGFEKHAPKTFAALYVKERAELSLGYREESGVELDLSSSGRGCQQVLLLLSYMLANPGAILLLDEADAHLEILRQRDVYNLLTDIAAQQRSQIIAASHSEILLQEAAERDVVMAFVGKPHRIDTRSRNQVKKALESIRMADYYLAEQKGWMLYLEGSTDLAILRSLAARTKHPAAALLHDSVPVIYLGSNQPPEARLHYQGLREAKPNLVGFALFDRLEKELQTGSQLTECMWTRREIENYLVTPASLRAFVQMGLRSDDLIEEAERKNRLAILETANRAKPAV